MSSPIANPTNTSPSDLNVSLSPSGGRIHAGRFGLVAAALSSLGLLSGCDGPSREEAAAKVGSEGTQQVDRLLADASFIGNQSITLNQVDSLRLALLGRETGRTYSQFNSDLQIIIKQTGFTNADAITALELAYKNPEIPGVTEFAQTITEIKSLLPTGMGMASGSLIDLALAKFKSQQETESVLNYYWLIQRSGAYTQDLASEATLRFLAP